MQKTDSYSLPKGTENVIGAEKVGLAMSEKSESYTSMIMIYPNELKTCLQIIQSWKVGLSWLDL